LDENFSEQKRVNAIGTHKARVPVLGDYGVFFLRVERSFDLRFKYVKVAMPIRGAAACHRALRQRTGR